MVAVKNLSSSPEVIEEQLIHEPHPQEYIQPCNIDEENEESWTTYNGEKPLEPDIEEISTCLYVDPLRTQENSHPIIKYLHGMVEEDMSNELNKEVNLELFYFIEIWFQATIRPYHSFIFPYFLTSSLKQLVLHTQVCVEDYILNLSMGAFLHLSCTWLHWKYSYT